MRPIRAFLFAQGENGQWGCQVFRDFEPLLEAAVAANGSRQYPVGVHVGFERPDTEAVAGLLSKQTALVFLSNGATGTMPLPVRASQTSIGSIGETTFHTALDGFGYQIEQADEAASASTQPLAEATMRERTVPRGWVATLADLESDLAEKLYSAGIWDDDSYLMLEAHLNSEVRYRAGMHRYEILVGERPNADSLIEHLGSIPPWLSSLPIWRLDLTVRAKNVCRANNIETVKDFAKYGLAGLSKLWNLGQKSVTDIGRELAHQFISGRPLTLVAPNLDMAPCGRPRDVAAAANQDFDGLDTDDVSNSRFDAHPIANISDGLMDIAQMLSQREQSVWNWRLGYHCTPMTLQQIADQIDLTRERVRQIEVKIYRKIQEHTFWDELSRRVQEHLRGRTSPLFLNGLAAIDQWFEGAEDLASPLREISDHIPRLGFHILSWNDSPVISLMSQAQWLEAIDEAKSMLTAIAEQNLSERDVLSQATGVLIGKGEDMREALQEEVSKLCVWSTQPDGSRVLSGFGRSATALVSAVLQESETPLHIDEIQRRVRAHSTYEATNVRNIHRAVSEVGILFGRGTYGLIKHCPLDASQMLAIRAEVEDIIAGGSPSKQWHSSELYDELLNRGFSYEGKLTKYIINIALANSPTLVYLRRMIWGVRGKWNENADARLDVKQAIISLLENEGKPMSTAQIRSRLVEGRGLNTYFQIWTSSPLVKLGPGLWGLEGRDLDMEHAREMAYRLLKELAARQEGMHTSEVAAFLGLGSEDEVSMLVSVANKDGLRMDKGQYCYLQPWGESRRISVWEAATSTLKAHPQGLSRGELQLFVDRIAKRKVDRQGLSSILQNIDAAYDPESNLWKFTGIADEDGEDDEGAADLSLEA
ncbi:DNA-directed RNA polymerase subunit alpha C-terminal domain-containing protein [Burkholderia contaminans]|uniref:DNA-directed RNA polymerase subunit alpha C-terminal domain-containing protein n=2 Tax=Burkholderia contaminans TaxID=488447 RepID=UPI001CF284ED|nr:DNA-directed RNA polymerase subunit alpha C-terminal domain-containing protein [Burkholderia contaminans]